jgi:hypothetical protein
MPPSEKAHAHTMHMHTVHTRTNSMLSAIRPTGRSHPQPTQPTKKFRAAHHSPQVAGRHTKQVSVPPQGTEAGTGRRVRPRRPEPTHGAVGARRHLAGGSRPLPRGARGAAGRRLAQGACGPPGGAAVPGARGGGQAGGGPKGAHRTASAHTTHTHVRLRVQATTHVQALEQAATNCTRTSAGTHVHTQPPHAQAARAHTRTNPSKPSTAKARSGVAGACVTDWCGGTSPGA